MKLLLSYDLRVPGRDYKPLYARLGEWSATRILESVWITNTQSNATALRDDLLKYIDANDGLAVVELAKNGAWHELIGQSGQRLKTILES